MTQRYRIGLAVAGLALTALLLWLGLPSNKPEPLTASPQTSPPLSPQRPLLTLSATNYLGNQTYTNHPVTQRVGLALDILGYDLQIMHNPGLRSLAMANSGVVDGELIRIRSAEDEYPNLIQVPVALMHAEVGLYTHHRHAVPGDSWKTFQPQRLASVKGMMLMEKLPAQFDNTPTISAQNYQQAVHQLIAGRADLTLLPVSYVNQYLAPEESSQLVLLNPVLPQVSGYLHLHKRHRLLLEPLTKLLACERLSSEPDSCNNEALAPNQARIVQRNR